jgi:predicted DNA-binding protein
MRGLGHSIGARHVRVTAAAARERPRFASFQVAFDFRSDLPPLQERIDIALNLRLVSTVFGDDLHDEIILAPKRRYFLVGELVPLRLDFLQDRLLVRDDGFRFCGRILGYICHESISPKLSVKYPLNDHHSNDQINICAEGKKYKPWLGKKMSNWRMFVCRYAREAILHQLENIEDYRLARRRLARGGTRMTAKSLEQQLKKRAKRR